MLCLTLSNVGQNIGIAGPTGFTPLDSLAVPYVVRVQPAECAPTDYILVTKAEMLQAEASPFKLTWDQGGAVSSAILLVWATGWAFRVLVRQIRESHISNDGGES